MRDVRRIFRFATVGQLLSKKIVALFVKETRRFDPISAFSLHYTAVLRVLRTSKIAKYIKRKKCSQLTPPAKGNELPTPPATSTNTKSSNRPPIGANKAQSGWF